MSAKVAAGQWLSEGASSQWSSVMAKVSAISGLPAIIDKISPAWAGRMEAVRCHIPGRDTDRLREIQQEAMLIARDMKKVHLQDRLESWRAFSHKQVLTGASIAHRLVKRGALPCCDTTTSGSGQSRTASPQAGRSGKRLVHLAGGMAPPWESAVGPLARSKGGGNHATDFGCGRVTGCQHFP